MRRLMYYGSGTTKTLTGLVVRQGLPLALDPDFKDRNFISPTYSSNLSMSSPPAICPQPGGTAALFTRNSTSGSTSSRGAWLTPNIYTMAEERYYPLEFSGTIESAAASAEYYAFGGGSPYLYVQDWATNTVQTRFDTTGLGTVMSMAFSPDGSKLYLVHGNSPYLRMYNVSDGTYVNAGISAGNFRYVLHVCADGTVLTWGASSPYLSRFSADLSTRLQSITSSTYYAGRFSGFLNHPTNPDKVIGFSQESSVSLIEITLSTASTEIIPTPWSGTYGMVTDHTGECFWVLHSSYEGRYLSRVEFDYTVPPAAEQGPLVFELPRTAYGTLILLEKDLHQITGTVRDIDNNPAEREVYAYRRSDGFLMAKAVSDPATGNYRLLLPDAGPYDIQFRTLDGELLNDLFYARAIPEPVT